MKCRYPYKNLERHFTLPNRSISPFYGYNPKIPRKLKKKIKLFCYETHTHYDTLTNGQRLWYYLEKSNPSYKTFLIQRLCGKYITIFCRIKVFVYCNPSTSEELLYEMALDKYLAYVEGKTDSIDY